ncbi:hypothetical protein DSM104299_04142 [Baekduia alba]|nr:hypothetical protein DSM104299_04142 [Baekduia alba]
MNDRLVMPWQQRALDRIADRPDKLLSALRVNIDDDGIFLPCQRGAHGRKAPAVFTAAKARHRAQPRVIPTASRTRTHLPSQARHPPALTARGPKLRSPTQRPARVHESRHCPRAFAGQFDAQVTDENAAGCSPGSSSRPRRPTAGSRPGRDLLVVPDVLATAAASRPATSSGCRAHQMYAWDLTDIRCASDTDASGAGQASSTRQNATTSTGARRRRRRGRPRRAGGALARLRAVHPWSRSRRSVLRADVIGRRKPPAHLGQAPLRRIPGLQSQSASPNRPTKAHLITDPRTHTLSRSLLPLFFALAPSAQHLSHSTSCWARLSQFVTAETPSRLHDRSPLTRDLRRPAPDASTRP